MDTYTRDAYATAEREAAAFLFSALCLTPGRDAFIGHPPAPILGVTFQFDEAPREYGAQFQVVRAIRNVALYASLRIVAATRAEVATRLSTAIAAFPFSAPPESAAVLSQLRIRDDGLAAIEPMTVTLRDPATGDAMQADAWSVDLGLDAVFSLRQKER